MVQTKRASDCRDSQTREIVMVSSLYVGNGLFTEVESFHRLEIRQIGYVDRGPLELLRLAALAAPPACEIASGRAAEAKTYRLFSMRCPISHSGIRNAYPHKHSCQQRLGRRACRVILAPFLGRAYIGISKSKLSRIKRQLPSRVPRRGRDLSVMLESATTPLPIDLLTNRIRRIWAEHLALPSAGPLWTLECLV